MWATGRDSSIFPANGTGIPAYSMDRVSTWDTLPALNAQTHLKRGVVSLVAPILEARRSKNWCSLKAVSGTGYCLLPGAHDQASSLIEKTFKSSLIGKYWLWVRVTVRITLKGSHLYPDTRARESPPCSTFTRIYILPAPNAFSPPLLRQGPILGTFPYSVISISIFGLIQKNQSGMDGYCQQLQLFHYPLLTFQLKGPGQAL